mmetsp:Transcript_18072/g.39718  ORF Transcript_18072/g.39718 Transcript_18072/m.39718 type:complete len:305 (+) Transcript_18072:1101-2015(+)
MSQRIITHGPRLGVVEGRVDVEVQQVFGGVLSDTQVPRRRPELVVLRSHRRGRLVEVLHLLAQVFIVGGVAVAVRVAIGVGVASVGVAGVGVRVLPLGLAAQLPPALLPLLLQELLLPLQLLLQLGPLLHLGRLGGPARVLDPLPLVLDLLVVVGLEAVPAVALAVVVQLEVLDVLVRHEVLTVVDGLHVAWPLHAFLLGVRRRSAVLACALEELGLDVALHPAAVPVLAARLLQVPRLLMAQRRRALVEVPRRVRDELRIVGVDHLACGGIDLGGRGTRGAGLLQLLLFPLVVHRLGRGVRHR